MKAALSDCFPDPLTPSWPFTANQVMCESRQVYVLTAIACTVPGAHVLVLHESEKANHMRSCMTRGCRYIDFDIEPETTGEQMANFLHHRYLSSVTSDCSSKIFSSGNNSIASPGPETSAAQSCVVACIGGAHHASPDVLSVLMDVTRTGQVRATLRGANDVSEREPPAEIETVTHHLPLLHVVLFCYGKYFSEVLSEEFRACFALSMYVSLLTMDRAPALRSNSSFSSNIIHKANMLFLMSNPDLVDTVSVSVHVSAYLRHLLLVLRGNLVTSSNAAGVYAIRQPGMMLRLLRAAAALFQPSSEVLVPRILQESNAAAPSSGKVETTPFLTSSTSRSYSGESAAKPSNRTPSSPRRSPVLASTALISKLAPNLSHVIASPTDVICLLCPMVAHLYTISIAPDASPSMAGSDASPHRTMPTGVESPDWRSTYSIPQVGFHLSTESGVDNPFPSQSLSTANPALQSNSCAESSTAIRSGGLEEDAPAEKIGARRAVTKASYLQIKQLLRETIISYSDPAPG